MLKGKLLKKILANYILMLCVCTCLIGYFISRVIKERNLDQFSEEIRSKASFIRSVLKEPLLGNNNERVEIFCRQFRDSSDMIVTIAGDGGKILFTSLQKGSKKWNTERVIIREYLEKEQDTIYYDRQHKMAYFSLPVEFPEKQMYLIVSSSMNTLNEQNRLITVTVFLYITLAFVISLGIGYLLLRRSVNPLSNIVRIAKNYINGNFSRKAEVSASDDELKELANAINTLGNNLQVQRQIITDDENKLKAIINNMNDSIITTDLKERIILINNAAKALFGISEITLNHDFLWEKLRNKKLRDSLKKTIDSGTGIMTEIEITSPQKKLLQLQLSPIQISKETHGVLMVFYDITELRKLENTRKEFVANVSHELRTPLTSIKGYVETLLENYSTNGGHTEESLKIIMKHTQRLDNLIKDILELSRLETKELKIEFHRLDILKCIKSFIQTYKEMCAEKGQTFKLYVSQELSVLESNEYLLQQLLTNLIDNAIKYTQKGGIIDVRIEPLNDTIRIEVSDTGAGIPHEHIPRIFERFYRIDPARSREMGGTGLGLSIVKHIVNLHHGSIKLDSEVGVGSKFTIILPQSQGIN